MTLLSNEDTYTYKIYLRNKMIFKGIKIFLSVFYLLILIWFIVELKRYSFNPILMIITSLMFLAALLLIRSWQKQNRDDLHNNYQTWGKGAGAELYILQELSSLGRNYKIVPDFNTGKGNIDFIVICEKGVFVIEVKATKGLISYNNDLYINGNKIKRDYIHQTMSEVMFLSDLLQSEFNKQYYITGILEFAYGKVDTTSISRPIHNIWIGGKGFYKYVFQHSRNSLTIQEIENIYNFLLTKQLAFKQ